MPKQGYHHGNLKEALTRSALELIAQKGPHGFTLSEAAKNASVTPAAVYRHFEGRSALLTEVALQGFHIFAEEMEKAFASGGDNVVKAFEATGRAYLSFARRYPSHYVAMFESGLSLQNTPALNSASQRAISVLTKSAISLSEAVPADQRPPPQMFASHVWAMSHGVVELFARGNPGAMGPFSAEDLLETGIGIYLRGLGLIPMDKA